MINIKDESVKIYKTKDYDKFSFLKGNRPVMMRHVAQIATSVSEDNLLSKNPIVVNEKFEIIDGQHRFTYCKNANEYVYYVIADNADIKTTKLLNVGQKSWSLINYVDMHASQNNANYVRFKKLLEETYLAPTTALMLLGVEFPKEQERSILKSGRLIFTNEDYESARQKGEYVNALKNYVTNKRFSQQFTRELMKVIEANKITELFKALEKTGRKISGRWSTLETREVFESLIGKY